MSQRRLTVLDPRRELDHEYKSSIDYLPYKKEYSKTEIVADPSSHALDSAVWIFTRFNWRSPELREILKKEQDRFLNGDLFIY